MNISICITVLNEEKTIGELLKALVDQTIKADEIIVVDGGSEDKTLEIIRHWQKKHNNILCVKEKGSIAHGRNTACELASGDIIATTDAGCIPRKDWLEKITYYFKYPDVGIVAGFYTMPAKIYLNQAINCYLGIPPKRFDNKKFLPSTRSVAFTKKTWEELGGFNETISLCGEDTAFFYNAVKKGVKIIRQKEARVVWNEVANFKLTDFLKKTYQYAKGDVQTNIWLYSNFSYTSHNFKVLLIYIRYIIGAGYFIYTINYPTNLPIAVLLIILYLLWPIYKWRDVVKRWGARVYLPVVQLSSDLAVMAGFAMAIVKKIKPAR